MCLLDGVEGWDGNSIHCRSGQYFGCNQHPLRYKGRLGGINLVEYGAQAAAVHASLLSRHSGVQLPAGGFLAGLRDVRLPEQDMDAMIAPLDIHAYREMGDAQGMIYSFEVKSAGVVCSQGRLTIACS